MHSDSDSDRQRVNTLIAGWVAGYLMAVASTIVLVFLTVRFSTPGGLLDRWVANEVPRPILAVPIFVGTTLAWTLAGLILATVYEVADMSARAEWTWQPELAVHVHDAGAGSASTRPARRRRAAVLVALVRDVGLVPWAVRLGHAPASGAMIYWVLLVKL